MTETTVNPMAAQISASRTMVEGLIARANEAATAVRSVQNQSSAVSDLLKESDDERLVKFRQQLEKLDATRAQWVSEAEAIAKTLLPQDDTVNVDEKTAEYKEAKAAAKALVDALKILGGDDAVKDLPELLSLGRGGTAGVTGIKRPRVDRIRLRNAQDDATAYSEVKHVAKQDDGTEKVTVSFSVLAQKIKSEYGEKVDANTLREHAEGVAGEYDTWASRNGEPFEFAVSVGDDENRKHLMVEVTPQNG
jgi:hypothetical protein